MMNESEKIHSSNCTCFCHTEGFAGDISQHKCCVTDSDKILALEKQVEEQSSLLHELAWALRTVKPWCAATHGHKTCDIKKVNEVLEKYENYKKSLKMEKELVSENQIQTLEGVE